MRACMIIVHAMIPGYRSSSIFLHIDVENREQHGFLTIVHVLLLLTKTIPIPDSSCWNGADRNRQTAKTESAWLSAAPSNLTGCSPIQTTASCDSMHSKGYQGFSLYLQQTGHLRITSEDAQMNGRSDDQPGGALRLSNG